MVGMYRIRLETGEETEFNSFEELSFGIVSGIVGPESEIYHERAGKWLPIRVHPEYKRAAGSAPPPPPAGQGSSNGRTSDGLPTLLREPDPHVPVRSDRGDDGSLDLLTLLDLGDLESADSGKVQESALGDGGGDPPETAADWVDPADWIGETDLESEVAPAAEAEAEGGVEDVLSALAGDDEEEAASPEAVAPPTAEREETPEAISSTWEEADGAPVLEYQPEESDEVAVTDEVETVGDTDPVDMAVADEDEIAAPVDLPLEGEDYLGDMLDSGDSDLTSPALDADEHHRADDPDPPPSYEPALLAAAPELEAIPESVSAPGTEFVAEPGEGEPEAAREDDYGSVFAPAAQADEETEPASGEQSDNPPEMGSEVPESVETAAGVTEDAAPSQAPPLAAAGAAPEPRAMSRREFDLELGGTPEPRGGLRDLFPFDLPKPAILGGAAGAVAVAVVAGWLLLGSRQPAAGTEPNAGDSVAVAPITPPPTRPTVDLAAQRRTYERAYDQSGSVLEDEIRRSGINYLFSSSRFSSEGDMLAARRAIAQARTAVTAYRTREDSIERAFPDADPSLEEPRVYAELTDDILSVSDGVYAILLGHLDDYAIRSGSVTFTDSAVEAQYTRLLRELERLLTLAGEAQNDRPPTLRRVFDAVDATSPPPLAIIAPPPPLPGIASPNRSN